MNLKRRWYDKNDEAIKAFEILEKLDVESRRRLSVDLIEIVKQIKNLHKEEEEPTLSLGIERVMGLYQQSVNERRWYDKSKDIKYAIKTMSTLPTDDFLNIMEGLSVSAQD